MPVASLPDNQRIVITQRNDTFIQRQIKMDEVRTGCLVGGIVVLVVILIAIKVVPISISVGELVFEGFSHRSSLEDSSPETSGV